MEQSNSKCEARRAQGIASRAGSGEQGASKGSFVPLCPFLPAGRKGPRLSRFGGTGHVPAKSRAK